MDEKPLSFASACKIFFGLAPDQTLSDFMAEVRTLSEQDRAEMAPQLAAALGRPVAA